MRVVSDRAKAPPAAKRIKRSAMTVCASNASMAVCDDTENQLFQLRNRLLIVPFPIRRHIRRARFLPMTKSTVGITVTARDASTGQATGKRQHLPARRQKRRLVFRTSTALLEN
jgi:hypothetical protein